MTRWSIEIPEDIQKKIRAIDQANVLRILKAITKLAHEDEGDVKQLEAEGKFYRLRVGDYRVIFTRIQEKITILVVDVGHRREIYKRWKD